MKKLWTFINKQNLSILVKQRTFLAILIVGNLILGGLVWLLLFRTILPEISWLICFMGYPALFLGFFGGMLYLYRHDFTVGLPECSEDAG
ncbi:MAG: hypothetical protein ACI4DU_10515 [Lachnospiraceae bacterium]